jgi:hypothetical protein
MDRALVSLAGGGWLGCGVMAMVVEMSAHAAFETLALKKSG